MSDYHFLSTWRIQAPIEEVWEEIFHSERWPSWWKYVDRVDQLDPGDPDGVGRRQHLVFTTRLPYRLGFDIQTRRVEAPTTLEAVATGELEGVGRWTLSSDDGWTLVRYTWDVHTTRWWMNLLAPLARPAFSWNHDALMLEAAQSLAHRLVAQLELPNARPRPRRPARTLAWGGFLAALLVSVVTRRRRRRRPHRRGSLG
jgi:Polyketide cyclase / dehydrase and lipid transport